MDCWVSGLRVERWRLYWWHANGGYRRGYRIHSDNKHGVVIMSRVLAEIG